MSNHDNYIIKNKYSSYYHGVLALKYVLLKIVIIIYHYYLLLAIIIATIDRHHYF